MTRTVTTVRKCLLETFDVESFGALFAVPDAAVEEDFYVCVGGVGEQAYGLLIPTRVRWGGCEVVVGEDKHLSM